MPKLIASNEAVVEWDSNKVYRLIHALQWFMANVEKKTPPPADAPKKGKFSWNDPHFLYKHWLEAYQLHKDVLEKYIESLEGLAETLDIKEQVEADNAMDDSYLDEEEDYDGN